MTEDTKIMSDGTNEADSTVNYERTKFMVIPWQGSSDSTGDPDEVSCKTCADCLFDLFDVFDPNRDYEDYDD